MSEPLRWVAFVSALGLVACGSDTSVTVAGSIEGASLALEQRALGTFLAGSFDLRVSLGKHADGNAQVDDPRFSLASAEGDALLQGAPVAAAPTTDTFPIVLRPGDTKLIPFALDADDPIASDATGELCASDVRLDGAVAHSLGGGSTAAVRSAPFAVAGCP